MPRISSYMLCDTIANIQIQPNSSIQQLISPQAVLRPPFIPGTFSFGISICVLGADFQEQNVINFCIINPAKVLVYSSGDIDIGKLPIDASLPEEYNGIVLSTDIRNLELQSEGEYELDLFINKQRVGTCQIPIFKRSDKE